MPPRHTNEAATQFLAALVPAPLPATERMIVCAFPGDPARAAAAAWTPRAWTPGQPLLQIPRTWNAYIGISSFRVAADGTWRRRRALFAAGHALMVDDVGTKVSPTAVTLLPPSARVETSPGNEQWWYMLDEPEQDEARFDALIRAFIAGRLLGRDPGMGGVTRVGRLPGFRNGKRQCGAAGFECRLVELAEDRAYGVDELVKGFGLELRGRNVPPPHGLIVLEEHLRRNRAFLNVYRFLHSLGMIKRRRPDAGGWTEVRCPWTSTHTGAVDTGAAIAEPGPENDWWGAFRCHHGHCAERRWTDLLEWVGEAAAEQLATVNAVAMQGVRNE